MSKAIGAIGTLIQMDDGAGNYTTIPECKDIDGPKLTSDELDVTSHDSVGAFAETIPSFLDAGTIDFNMNNILGSSVQRSLMSHWLHRDRFNIKMIFPVDLDNTIVANRTTQMKVFVSNFSNLAPVKGVLERTVSLRVTEAPIFGGVS